MAYPRLAFQGCVLEYQLITGDPARPTIVFLHDGLGSISTWRDFPAALCRWLGAPGLLFSREGYGGSSTWRSPLSADYLHKEAHQRLPELLRALGIERPYLFGHSDGASISLLYGARHPARGMTLLAPHVFVEPLTLAGVRALQTAWQTMDLRGRLAAHHADPETAFLGWSRTWLDPAFTRWDIRAELRGLACPVLAVQGSADPFGTMAHILAVQEAAIGCVPLLLEGCGHAPHREQPAVVLEATACHYRNACGFCPEGEPHSSPRAPTSLPADQERSAIQTPSQLQTAG